MIEKGVSSLEYFPRVKKDIGCGTFREVKKLVWNRFDRIEAGGNVKPVLGLHTL